MSCPLRVPSALPQPLGWVTGLTRDGAENLRLAAAAFPLRKAAKPLVCREAKEANSKKLDEIPRGTMVRVVDEFTLPDGTIRAHLAKDSVVVEEIGWITKSKPGEENDIKLDIPPMLTSTFATSELPTSGATSDASATQSVDATSFTAPAVTSFTISTPSVSSAIPAATKSTPS